MTNQNEAMRERLAMWFSENLTFETFEAWADKDFADALLAAGWRDDGDERVQRARAEAWDEAVGHVAQVALVGSAGLNDECFESNPYRAALDGGPR